VNRSLLSAKYRQKARCQVCGRRAHGVSSLVGVEDSFAIEGFCYTRVPGIRFQFRVHECVEGDAMGKEARVGLLLAGACCLLACMVDWIIVEL
jgi:hypothetical protein